MAECVVCSYNGGMLYDKSLTDVPVVVLDTETTGLKPELGHRVVEIGAVRFENWQITGEINQLVDPYRPIEPKASEISGITDEDVLGQPKFADIADDLLALLDGALIVAHNAQFDAAFVGTELWLAGKYDVTQLHKPILPNSWLCTLRLARSYFYFGRNNLASVAHQLGVRIGKTHRALNDVYMTAEILKRMAQKLPFKTVGEWLHAQNGAIYTAIPPQIDLPDPIDIAVTRQQPLDILYISKGQTYRTVTPYYATAHQGNTYLIAYCHLRKEQRSFRLDRIFSAELLRD